MSQTNGLLLRKPNFTSIDGKWEGLPKVDPATKEVITIQQMIIVSAATINPHDRMTPFTAAKLVVRAWECYPHQFGLEGYSRQYPDSNRVLYPLMGDRGLVKRGHMLKLKEKVYCLTRQALKEVDRLTTADSLPEPEGVPLPKVLERFVLYITSSSAFVKFNVNKSGLLFTDACRFWDLPDSRLTPEVIDGQLTKYTRHFNELDELLAKDDGLLANGRVVTAGDARALRNIHEHLKDRFERLLGLVGKRK